MNEALADWVKKLDTQCLPALRDSTERLRVLGSKDDSNMDELVSVIESDPGLTLRLIRYINNLRHKHLRTEITTVRHGLMMLGMSHMQKIPQNVALVEELSDAARERLLRHFSQALHAGYQVRDLARLTKETVADELYLAAMLHNLGAMLLDLHAPDEMARVRELVHQKQMESDKAEYVVFGFTTDQLTVELARLWKLPEILIDSLRGENAQHKRVLSVMLSAQVAEAAEDGWYTPQIQELLEPLADLLLSDIGSVATLIHQNAVASARSSMHLGVPHPAITLLYPIPPMEEENVTAIAQPQTSEAHETFETGDYCLAPQRPVLIKVLKRLTNHHEEPLLLRDVLALAMEGMHDGLGLNRVMFAMLTPDKGQLKSRRILGSDNDPQFNRFAVDLNSHNLFVRLLEKPQSLWLDDNNRAKFFPLIPISIHKLLRNDSFYVMSLFIRDKPIGIFYADRHSRSCRLDAQSYKYFKHLVTQASMCLAQMQVKA